MKPVSAGRADGGKQNVKKPLGGEDRVLFHKRLCEQ
jgi:hypothetical protein